MDSVAGTYVSGGFEPAELESKHGGRTCRIAGIYWTLAAVVMVVSLGQASAYGQVLSVDDNRAAQFIEPSRTLRQILRDAETAAGEKRWGDVVLGLGELLSRPLGLDPDDPLGGEDFFLDAPEPGGVHKESCRRRAERMLAEMPAEGLQIYRLRYQAEAKRLLDQAAEKRDWDQLEEVSRRFPHTQSGYEAAVLMAGASYRVGNLAPRRFFWNGCMISLRATGTGRWSDTDVATCVGLGGSTRSRRGARQIDVSKRGIRKWNSRSRSAESPNGMETQGQRGWDDRQRRQCSSYG